MVCGITKISIIMPRNTFPDTLDYSSASLDWTNDGLGEQWDRAWMIHYETWTTAVPHSISLSSGSQARSLKELVSWTQSQQAVDKFPNSFVFNRHLGFIIMLSTSLSVCVPGSSVRLGHKTLRTEVKSLMKDSISWQQTSWHNLAWVSYDLLFSNARQNTGR